MARLFSTQACIEVSPQLLSMYRALLTSESVARQLGPADLRATGREFFRCIQIEDLLASLTPERIQLTIFSWLVLLGDSPGQVQQIVSDLARGQLGVRVTASETSRTAHVRNLRARLLATAISTVPVAVLLSSRPWLPVVLGVPLAWLLSLTLAVLFLSLLVQWRRLP